jgi:histidyl-tRNA synthetase
VLKITTEILRDLDFEGRYTIKVNHRKVLDGMFQVCGVPQEKIRSISSAVDKLDKSPWEEGMCHRILVWFLLTCASVRREMTEEKRLDPAVADKIGEFVKPDPTSEVPIGSNCRARSLKVLQSLESNESLVSNPLAKQGIADLRLLFDYLEIWNCSQYVSIDMSLARGLDCIFSFIAKHLAKKLTDARLHRAYLGSSHRRLKAKGDGRRKRETRDPFQEEKACQCR